MVPVQVFEHFVCLRYYLLLVLKPNIRFLEFSICPRRRLLPHGIDHGQVHLNLRSFVLLVLRVNYGRILPPILLALLLLIIRGAPVKQVELGLVRASSQFAEAGAVFHLVQILIIRLDLNPNMRRLGCFHEASAEQHRLLRIVQMKGVLWPKLIQSLLVTRYRALYLPDFLRHR